MSNMLILPPLPIAGVTATRGSGAANLLTPDPKEVWVDSAVSTAATLTIDLGSVQQVDTLFLGFTNADAGATWSASYGVAASNENALFAATALRDADAIGPRYHGLFHKPDGPVAARYIAVAVTQPAAKPALFAGIIMAGAAFVPTYNRDWGPGRQLIDTGNKTSLRSGGFGTAKGARKAVYQWTLAELLDSEVLALWKLAKDRGETDPIVVCEDPDAAAGRNEGIYYGLFNRFAAYDRQDPDWTQWGLSLEEWV